jgi:cobalt-zinc-cadmium efflux system outer membrane protein
MLRFSSHSIRGGRLSQFAWRLTLAVFIMNLWTQPAAAQQSFTWQEVRDKFEAANPALRAGRIGIAESRAQEVTAYLRPNPQTSLTLDQVGNVASGNPFSGSTLIAGFSYLHERQNKRELRQESAQMGTGIAESSLADQERSLLFSLRNAFIQTLQAKSILDLAQQNLRYYDQVLAVNRERFQAGDASKIDLSRLELQRVQYESDVETSTINLRTAKIQLLTLLNDRTPVEQFDVTGPFDFMEQTLSLNSLRAIATDTRPDLKAAVEAVDKARTDHQLAVANGSTDPIFNIDFGFPSISQAYLSYQPPLREFIGVGVSVPLRIFDRNQGEKMRTELDIDRSGELRDAALAQVFSDVDTAYAALNGSVNLLRPYKEKYLAQSLDVRDTVSFSFEQGGASLLDFLNAQNDYRTTQRAYLSLVGSYLTAAAQLNLAVGREVIP